MPGRLSTASFAAPSFPRGASRTRHLKSSGDESPASSPAPTSTTSSRPGQRPLSMARPLGGRGARLDRADVARCRAGSRLPRDRAERVRGMERRGLPDAFRLRERLARRRPHDPMARAVSRRGRSAHRRHGAHSDQPVLDHVGADPDRQSRQRGTSAPTAHGRRHPASRDRPRARTQSRRRSHERDVSRSCDEHDLGLGSRHAPAALSDAPGSLR